MNAAEGLRIYPSERAVVYIDDFKTRKEYYAAVKIYEQHYSHSAKVVGGRIFFPDAETMRIWKQQK